MEHTVTRLVREAARLSHLSLAAILSSRRDRDVARVRFAVMLVARELNYSTPDIGRRLGGRDHTTVVHGVRQAKKLLEAEDVMFAYLVTALRKGVSGVL